MINVGSGFCTIDSDFGGLDAHGTCRTFFKCIIVRANAKDRKPNATEIPCG